MKAPRLEPGREEDGPNNELLDRADADNNPASENVEPIPRAVSEIISGMTFKHKRLCVQARAKKTNKKYINFQ